MQYMIRSTEMVLEPADVVALHREVVVVDVRDRGAYAAGHIAGAINVSLKDIELGWSGPDGRLPFVVVGRSDEQSRLGAAALRRLGRDAYAVRGGIVGWRDAGEALVTNSGRPPFVA